jgi:hypothetical protein
LHDADSIGRSLDPSTFSLFVDTFCDGAATPELADHMKRLGAMTPDDSESFYSKFDSCAFDFGADVSVGNALLSGDFRTVPILCGIIWI